MSTAFNPKVTLIHGASGFTEAKEVHILTLFDKIKKCSLQNEIDGLRAIPTDTPENKKLNSEAKKKLYAVMVSGTFSGRGDANLKLHSGLCTIDVDNLPTPEVFKANVATFPFVYGAFISPNGNGLKVICRIPQDKDKHKGHYLALCDKFGLDNLDTTSQNIERLCFMSADADIYINTDAVEFTEYKAPKEYKTIANLSYKEPQYTDYNIINRAVKMIANAPDGKKYDTLLKAGNLMGGYIAGGYIQENEAVRILTDAISQRDIANIDTAIKGINASISHGKSMPIYESERNVKEYEKELEHTSKDIDMSFIGNEEEIMEYINQVMDGTLEIGLDTGISELDEHFRFKRGNFVIVNGTDNVGKSTVIWYLMLLASLRHDWRWAVLANENKTGYVRRKLIEFYTNTPLQELKYNKPLFDKANQFIKEHFTIIKSEEMYSPTDVMAMMKKLMRVHLYDGLLIDPYNSLKIDLMDSSKLSTHEYHYEVASMLRSFGKNNNISIYLNCHVVTMSARQKDTHGNPAPPLKADTEGGVKFANKADEFLTIHRKVHSEDEWMINQIHVRKVKEIETGGRPTSLNSPVLIKMLPGNCGYESLDGYNPITNKFNNGTPIKKIEPIIYRITEDKEDYDNDEAPF